MIHVQSCCLLVNISFFAVLLAVAVVVSFVIQSFSVSGLLRLKIFLEFRKFQPQYSVPLTILIKYILGMMM